MNDWPVILAPIGGAMAYVLSAVIAQVELLRSRPGTVAVVELAQGFGLLPISDELPDLVPGSGLFGLLPGGYDTLLAEWSGGGPVAYVEADYFGGTGEQWAAVWSAGQLVFGPLYKPAGEPFPPEGSPISQALRRLGVARGRHFDEFDAAGLLRHRHTSDWLRTAPR